MRVKPIFFFLIVGSIASFLMFRYGNPGIVNIGSPAPDATLRDENGREIQLSDYRGKVVFLNFWATWCLPCIEEMPEMETMNATFKDRKFQMLAVSVDLNWKTVKDFYKQHKLTIPAFLDPGHQVANAYKVFKFPETFIIDSNGFVVKHTWQARWASPEVLAEIDSLIRKAEGAPQVSEK